MFSSTNSLMSINSLFNLLKGNIFSALRQLMSYQINRYRKMNRTANVLSSMEWVLYVYIKY